MAIIGWVCMKFILFQFRSWSPRIQGHHQAGISTADSHSTQGDTTYFERKGCCCNVKNRLREDGYLCYSNPAKVEATWYERSSWVTDISDSRTGLADFQSCQGGNLDNASALNLFLLAGQIYWSAVCLFGWWRQSRGAFWSLASESGHVSIVCCHGLSPANFRILATPGRLLHVAVEMNLKLGQVGYVVFDEADRLFEMGFKEQLWDILKRLPDSRQTLLFSATMPKIMVEFANAGLIDPVLGRQ